LKRRSHHLEVFIEVETVVGDNLAVLVGLLLVGGGHDTSLLVVTDTLLEEVGLAGKGDRLHEVEGVGGVVVLLVAKGDEQTVSDELNVLAHQLGVHAEQTTREGIGQELLLDTDSLDNDVLDNLGLGAVVEVREQQTSEIGVETLVTRNKLVGESETRHQTTLLQPKDGSERAGEEDTLNGGEGNQALGEGGLLVIDPADGPLGLLGNARD
jgi:hypothetical protein